MALRSMASAPGVRATIRLCAILPAFLLGLALLSPVYAQTPPPTAQSDDRSDPIVRLVGSSGIKLEAPQIRVAQLFLAARAGPMDGAEFFARLADIPAGMKEVREVRTAIQHAGLADAFLGPKFTGGGTPVEKLALEHRRRVTERVILEALTSMPAGSSVFVAKVGKWATQAAEAMTFDGDIDFSFISADMRVAQKLKKTFDRLLREELGLAAAAHGADVVATAHGQGDEEVYTGEEGQGYAEQALEEAERKAQAEGKDVVFIERAEAGTLTRSSMSLMRATVSLERDLVVERSARLPDIQTPSDPGLSMEMIRHLLHDIKGSKEYPPGVLIVKASKYLQRSDQSAAEGGFKSSNDLSLGADKIVTLSKDADASKLSKFLIETFGTDGVVKQAASDAYVDSIERGIWQNVEISIHAKADGLEKRAAEAERATGEERERLLDALKSDTLKLNDTISAKRLLLEDAHIEMPATIEAQIARVEKVVETLKRLGRPINESEMKQKRLIEEMQKAKKPTALELAKALIFDSAVKGIEEVNAKLDFIDNYMFSELRGDRNFESFLNEALEVKKLLASTDAKTLEGARVRAQALKVTAQQGIIDANRRMNEMIQRTAAGRGVMHGVMAIGLVEEAHAYADAIWECGLSAMWDCTANNVAMEFFRHRVPMFSAAERIAVDGNPSDYAMAAWDLVVTLVPPIGLVQAAGGIAKDLGNTSIDLYWDDRLQVFVDEVYAGARFKPIAKTQEGDAWFATWRLVGVTYRGEFYDLKAFAEMRREDVKALAAELKKPRKLRDLSRPLYGHETGLIDSASVDKTLRQTLMSADPQLRFLDELSGHPQVGPLLVGQYADQKRVRWEEVKLAFLVELVDRLETRWARDWAAKSGQFKTLQAELARITRELEIADEVNAALEAAKPGRLSLIAAWLHARERDLFLQPDAVGSLEAEVGQIQEAIEAYRTILETRGKLEMRLGAVEARDGGLRLLTGPTQLRGLAAIDHALSADWSETVERLAAKAAEELLTLKVQLIGGSIAEATLDPGFDQDMQRRLTALDVWRYAWAKILSAGESAKRPGTLDDPAAATERLKAARATLLDEFAAHYRGAGVVEATIVDEGTGAAIERAEVRLGAAKATTDRQGLAILSGIQPGSYDLSASAPDHKPGSILALIYPVPVAEALGNRRAVKLALAPAKVEPRRSALTLRVADAGDGKPLAGAKVTIIGAAAKTPIVLQTGANGVARFDDLLPGDWIAAAEAADHEPAKSGTIVLPIGKTGASAATVSIALKRLAPSTKLDDKDKPQLTPPDGKTAETTPGKFKLDLTPNTLPPVDMTTWRATMNSLDLYLLTPSWTRLSPADREKAKGVIIALEAREKALWDAASAELALADAYLARVRAEAKKVFDGFRAKLPKSPAGPGCSGSSCVTDLEGNILGQRPICDEGKLLAVEAPALNNIDSEILRVRQSRERFNAFSTDHATYTNAMEGLDNLVIDQKKGDAWKTRGWTQTFPDPCGGGAVTVTLPPASVPAIPMPVDLGLSAKLAFNPKTLGQPEVEVVADAANGVAPYRFEFPGAIRATETRATFAAPFAKDPTAKARVRVTDAKGRVATAELPLEPAPVEVELTRTDAAGAELPVGGTATFAATLSSNGKLLDPTDWVLRWEPMTELRFASAEGPGVAANTATFLRPGQAKIWVVALRRQAGALVTVAESPQIEIDVVAPGLSLRLEPPAPFVGDTVTVRAREAPESNDADVSFRWALAGEAQSAGPTSDQRVYTFVATLDKPVTISLDTLARAKGDKVASAQVTVTPQARKVTATSPGPSFGAETTKIVLWKQGVGLVRLEKQITAFMDMTVKATIEPAPADPVRWAWSLNEGSSFSGNPTSAETQVQRSTPGAIEATAIARDSRGIELGRGAVSITVAVSDAAVREGRQKQKDLDDAKTRGDAAWAAGNVDAACAAGEMARAIQPDVACARLWCDGRDRIRSLGAEVDKALAPPTADGLQTAADKLKAIEAINDKATALAGLRRKIDAAKAATKASDGIDADRKGRLALLLAGAQAFQAQKWTECRETIGKALSGSEKVFKPEDGKIIDKARSLAAQAEAAEKKAADDATRKQAADAKTEAERKQRLGQLLAGAQACQAQKWAECRETIGNGLAGSDKVFKPEDGKIIDKARALGSRAEAEMLKAAAAKPITSDTAKEPSPPTTPKVESADTPTPKSGAPDNAKQSASSQAPAQPLANQPGAPFDGVYVGPSTREDGARGPMLTWTIAGSRISLVSDAAAEKRAWTGEIKPSGEFKVQVERIAYRGTVAGGSLTGAYAGELRMFNGTWSSTVKGTFNARRTTPGPAPTTLDGVYVGKGSDSSGEMSVAYTWTVSDSRVEVTESNQQQKSTLVGAIDPSGAFAIQGGPKHATVKGRITGNTLSATWDYPASEATGVADHGTLTATRASPQQPSPEPTQTPEERPPPTSAPAAPSANGYWKLDHVEYANPHGADEWTKFEDKFKILQRDNNQITFHEEMNDGTRLTYTVKWRVPQAFVPGQSPVVELSEICIEFKPGRNATQRSMGTALLDSAFGNLKLDDPICTVGGAARAEPPKWNIRIGRPGLKTPITVTADVLSGVEYSFVFAWVGGVAPPGGQP